MTYELHTRNFEALSRLSSEFSRMTTGDMRMVFRKKKLYVMLFPEGKGGGGTPQSGPYGAAPAERDTFFTFQVYERVGKSVI